MGPGRSRFAVRAALFMCLTSTLVVVTVRDEFSALSGVDEGFNRQRSAAFEVRIISARTRPGLDMLEDLI